MPKRGEHIHKRKDGRWEARYKCGISVAGKTLYKSVYAKTYAEAKEKQQKYMAEYRKGTIPERCVTFGSALALWQEVNKSRHKRATNMRYANLIDRHIAPELSNIRISQINTALLSDFMNRKLESGRLDGKGGLSPAYVRSIMLVINSVIEFSIAECLCPPVKINIHKVIEWAMQICDVLSYLHSQKPPIIYRDMKPANLMLKPNGNISIIDFGIAREYKEQNLADTTVLGTKGYAPPEQYSGQTDPRSDIFALGMTMHHLLTGIDPRNGEPYAPVRQWNPELSEGIEAIINKCVEPAAENRYQSCAELLVDLQDPSKVTKGWRKKLKRRLFSFAGAAALAVVAGIAGLALNLAATQVNNQDYDLKINSSDPTGYYEAITIYPARIDAYNKLIEYYKNYGAENDSITRIGNEIEKNADQLDTSLPEVAKLYYDIGKLYFADYDGALKARAANAKGYFEVAAGGTANFDKKGIASCYYSICKFMTSQSTTSEHALSDYTELFNEISQAMSVVEKADDNEANYDKISLYYVTVLLINDQSKYMAGVGFDQQEALSMMESAYKKSVAITSTLPYVTDLQDKIKSDYQTFVTSVNNNYNEVAKRQNGGN